METMKVKFGSQLFIMNNLIIYTIYTVCNVLFFFITIISNPYNKIITKIICALNSKIFKKNVEIMNSFISCF